MPQALIYVCGGWGEGHKMAGYSLCQTKHSPMSSYHKTEPIILANFQPVRERLSQLKITWALVDIWQTSLSTSSLGVTFSTSLNCSTTIVWWWSCCCIRGSQVFYNLVTCHKARNFWGYKISWITRVWLHHGIHFNYCTVAMVMLYCSLCVS